MSRCKQCNIEVLDETERCPLCHSVLEPTIEVENMYPDVKIKTRRMMLLSRIYLFVAIVAEAVLVAANHYGDFETAWSLVTGLFLRISGCPVCNPWKNRLYCQNNCFDFNCHIDIDCNRFCEWLPGMVGTVCVPGGDHFSRYRNFGLDVCEPEELAELYYVADFYDFVQFCSDYSVSDRNYLCAVSGARGTRNVCIFVPWNADHR